MSVSLWPYYMCRWGGAFRESGVRPSLYDVLVSWLRLQTPIDCIQSILDVYKVFYHLEMTWMYI
jgi:hypothetical protein